MLWHYRLGSSVASQSGPFRLSWEDTLVFAGCGSGQTLPIALNILLDDPDKQSLLSHL